MSVAERPIHVRALGAAAGLCLVAALLLLAGPVQADSRAGAGQVALFEGTTIDLSAGWDEAQACLVWSDRGVVECFRTEAEMDRRIDELADTESPQVGSAGVLASSCSSSLRLYDGTSYTGTVLYLADRGRWFNLSSYGFSNRTSSFKIGACSSYFADYSNGGGSWYPTSSTKAWKNVPAMAWWWNNRVSSVYIT